jgi:hypothetical protein
VNRNETVADLPHTVDALVERLLGGPAELVANINSPCSLRVEIDVRDCYHLCGPEWRAVFDKVTKAHQLRVEAGHAH